MILIVCVDNKNGMLFNRRRQSQDRMLRTRILEMTAQSRLWMNTYSAKQFDASAPQVTVADVRFTLDLSGFRLCQREDFAGSSHEKITEEIYTPCET